MSNQQYSTDDADEEMLFMEDAEVEDASTANPWTVFVVDDDADVHTATEMVLRHSKVNGRGIRQRDAYSGEEAIQMISLEREAVDLVLMDVVMESPTAGLDAVVRIRQELGLHDLPVILVRTGQPGHLDDAALHANPHIDGVLLKTAANAKTLLETVENGLLNGRRGQRVSVQH